MKNLVLLTLGLALAAVALPAAEAVVAPAEGSPEWMVERLFKDAERPDPARLFTAKMTEFYRTQRHMGAAFSTPEFTFKQVRYHESPALIAINVQMHHVPSKNDADYYVFLRPTTAGWRIDALRQFKIPGSLMQVVGMVMSQGSRATAEDLREVTLLRSLTATNAMLEESFRKDEEKFDQLVPALATSALRDVIHGARKPANVSKELWQKVRDADLYFAQVHPEQRWVECCRASLASSAVGYLWVDTRAQPPALDPDKYVYLKEIAPQWYLYRRH